MVTNWAYGTGHGVRHDKLRLYIIEHVHLIHFFAHAVNIINILMGVVHAL